MMPELSRSLSVVTSLMNRDMTADLHLVEESRARAAGGA